MEKSLPLHLLHDEYDNGLWAIFEDGTELLVKEISAKSNYNRIKGFRAHGSPYMIKLPFEITKDLAYLTGALLGDGCLITPSKRKKGGYYWKVDFTCQYEYSKIISRLIQDIFEYKPVLSRDKRKNDCWSVCIHSIVIYRFFNKVIGIPYGKKRGKTYWSKHFCESKDIFRHFLAGFTDTDGCVSKKYIAIVQKDRAFLDNLKEASERLLDIEFNGPGVNRSIEGEIVGWHINLGIRKKKDFLNQVPLKYKGP
jgi:hypothetical protein